MIVKVQLVTHSIIPNLNSGLVPIDAVGLVSSLLLPVFKKCGHDVKLLFTVYSNISTTLTSDVGGKCVDAFNFKEIFRGHSDCQVTMTSINIYCEVKIAC